MFPRSEKFADIIPRLEPLHEGAKPAELLILYFDPKRLHDQASEAVRIGKDAQERIELGLKITREWQARSTPSQDTRPEPGTPDAQKGETDKSRDLFSDDVMDDELHKLVAEEYGKLAEEAEQEIDEDLERYPALAKEAAIGRAVLREQLRLGLARRLIHGLAGAALSAAVIVPPLYFGFESVHERPVAESSASDQGLTETQTVALAVAGTATAALGGMVSFSTHGRRAGDRVALRKMLKKFGRPKFEEL